MRGPRFTGKVAVVTGGGSGIGAATARGLAAEGARVAVVDVNAEAAQSVAAELPGAQAFAIDVGSGAAIKEGFARILEAFGTVHVLVNSAGVIGKFTLEHMSEAEWDRVLDINLKGTALATQAVIAPMRANGGGAVVNVSSMAGRRISFAGGINYTASKFGVVGFTNHAAFELAAYGIRVNCVCPGPTLSGMTAKRTPEQLAVVTKRIPLGRWVKSEDVANGILFLASDEAAMCTGTALDVDGGILVSNGTSHEEYFAVRT